MKITEIYEEIMNALREKKFVGNFEVAIHRQFMQDVKITGYKRSNIEYPYAFSDKLQRAINEICFNIVSGAVLDGGFTFEIKGNVEYVYEFSE